MNLKEALSDLSTFKRIFRTRYDTERTLEMRFSLIRELAQEGLSDNVLWAIARVPRHLFVPSPLKASAYENKPLPIGFRQTISQPLMIGIMIDEIINNLNLHRDNLNDKFPVKVLEIGTGSGYQTALLCELFKEVYSVEIIPELLERATSTLKMLGYSNLKLKLGDGVKGFPEGAPFNAIIVSAAVRDVPEAWLSQLYTGGLIVLPIEEPTGWQYLALIRKLPEGIRLLRRGAVSFVKFLTPREAEKLRRAREGGEGY